MAVVPFALYDAFTDTVFGGSQGAVVSNAGLFNACTREQVAREIGAPATGFVTAVNGNLVSARFLSTVVELPMCGHGTICLMTRMIEQGVLNFNSDDAIYVRLSLPETNAKVTIHRRSDNRPLIMLDVQPPRFRKDSLDTKELANLLGLNLAHYSRQWPIETAIGDFVHLVVPLKNLESMRAIRPKFTELIKFCHKHKLQTIAVFCSEVEQPDHTLHVRDFCPAVGVPESAAAGTTNSALASYLIRHGIVTENNDGQIIVKSEQGHEINRPSSILSIISMKGSSISRLQVGGIATKVIDGQLHLPN